MGVFISDKKIFVNANNFAGSKSQLAELVDNYSLLRIVFTLFRKTHINPLGSRRRIIMRTKEATIVELTHFIDATRDSGYKNTAASIAELLDNALEAGATAVKIELSEGSNHQIEISVTDNGCGMTPSVLKVALQFGGSTRFNSRNGAGRYGMGLPNSSLSRARRVDVYSWTRTGVVWWTYLDIDEIASGAMKTVPKPKRIHYDSGFSPSRSGTKVVWSKCDRLEYKNLGKLITNLTKRLGQTFRLEIWKGNSIFINGVRLESIDPLFLNKGNNVVGAIPFGKPLSYQIRVPDQLSGIDASTITVRFTELPIEKWHALTNEEKRKLGITKRAGVSVLRAGREIDYGWFFMRSKRKENYDDWWRCEIHFDATLDELFGVTHTKQTINPTAVLEEILSPDIERIAHLLNSRVRSRYLKVKALSGHTGAAHLATSKDHLLEPPPNRRNGTTKVHQWSGTKGNVAGLAYRIEHECLDEPSFFVPLPLGEELVVLLNEEHPFYERVYFPVVDTNNPAIKTLHCYLELMLFAAARAECSITNAEKLKWARGMRESWSKALATFLD
jgi:histidine kinase/DNA gyrase B/HSP90-like ATPase